MIIFNQGPQNETLPRVLNKGLSNKWTSWALCYWICTKIMLHSSHFLICQTMDGFYMLVCWRFLCV
jgi:hypothetical protein